MKEARNGKREERAFVLWKLGLELAPDACDILAALQQDLDTQIPVKKLTYQEGRF